MKRKKENIVLERVQVEDYAAGGKGLARVDGKVIFVENAVPGDLLDVRLLKNKKDWAEGVPVFTHSLSADRVEPFCSHFGTCGGCQWQMLPYEKQLFYKQREVEETLKRIGKVSMPPVNRIIGASETRYYRNKIEYTFGTKEFTREAPPKRRAVIEEMGISSSQEQVSPPLFKGAGFHAKGFFDKIVDIDTCYLQHEPTNAIRKLVKEFGREKEWSFYDIRNHTGFLRTMQIRLCRTGQIMVNIVFGEDDIDKIKCLMDHLLKSIPSINTLLYTINTKWNDSMHDLKPVIYYGKGWVIEELSDESGNERFQFKIGPTSFFQTNTQQAEQLYRVARDFAELTGKETIYDLYCGTGSIGIFASSNAKKIIGVEMIEAAVEDARQNAALNNLSNTAFFTGDVVEICDDAFFETQGRPDVIITDPPRAGMHEKLVRKINAINSPIVVYVSCNPATQARDLNLLDPQYAVTNIQPVDMFPHTLHIENVVQLKRRDN